MIRAPGIPITFISDNIELRLHPALFTPCEWRRRRNQMFVIVGALQIHTMFTVESNELDDTAKPGSKRWWHGDTGDWLLRGMDDRCAVISNEQFGDFVRRVQQPVPHAD